MQPLKGKYKRSHTGHYNTITFNTSSIVVYYTLEIQDTLIYTQQGLARK